MANIQSSKKRIKTTAKKTLNNKIVRTKTKTYVKKVLVACEQNNKEEAFTAFKEASALLDKAGSKGIYHKNTVARKKSKLAKKVNCIA